MSSDRLSLSPGLVALRPKAAGRHAPPTGSRVEKPKKSEERPPSVDLGAIRNAAILEGRDSERLLSGDIVRRAAASLDQAVLAIRAAREADQREIETFAIDLACTIAEEIVHTVIERDAHDVRGMVRRILGDALADGGATAVVIEGHPDDLHHLPSEMGSGSVGIPVRTSADMRMPRGSFRVKGDGIEYYAGASERLDAIRLRLHREASHVPVA